MRLSKHSGMKMLKNWVSSGFKSFNFFFILRKFDINDSGQISAEELRAVLSKKYRFINRDEIEEVIKKADKNKDGLISIQEFADLLNF